MQRIQITVEFDDNKIILTEIGRELQKLFDGHGGELMSLNKVYDKKKRIPEQ